jgi:putative membrane protein insertion efficiency factor
MESKNRQAIISRILYLPRLPLLGLIWLYQKTVSPDHGLFRKLFPYGYCKYHPTCSEYGRLAIKKYGIFRGVPKSIWRIIRCNPWSDGGEDQP